MADVFISYSRKDADFVRRLHDALAKLNRDTWVDWEDIPPTAEWLAEVFAAIEAADTFICVLSPECIASKVCNQELAHAVEHNKRLVPLMRRMVADNAVPEVLSKLNYVRFGETDDFDKAFESLLKAIDTDLDWVRAHTRLDVRSSEWEKKGRDTSLLLRGTDLDDAELWLVRAGVAKERNPTSLQTEYIISSRHEQTREEHRWKALYEESEKRRMISVSQKLAAQALNHVDDQLDLSLLLSVEACRADNTLEARSALLTALQHNPHLSAYLSGHTVRHVHSIAFSPDGKTLASGGWDGKIILWDTATRQRFGTPLSDDHLGDVMGVFFSPDGKTLASATSLGIVLWDVASRQPLAQPLTLAQPLRWDPDKTAIFSPVALALSPDGKTLVSGDDFTSQHLPSIIFWDLASRKPLGPPIIGHKSFAFTPDSKTLAVGNVEDNSIELLDVATHNRVSNPLSGHNARIECLAFSPDGGILASGSEDGTIILWDVAAGQPLGQPLTIHKSVVNSVAFRPDGQILASGSGEKTIILWNLERIPDLQRWGTLAKPIEPVCQLSAAAPVYVVAFSPDGRTLAYCGGGDGRITLWDLTWSNMFRRSIEGLEVKDTDVVFSPDGRSLAAKDYG